MTNYVDITELSGDDVSEEQVLRLCHRYYWAGTHCEGRDVLEAACGPGQGLGHLASVARSVQAGDYSNDILNTTRGHYGDRIPLHRFDAQDMPFDDDSFDAVLMFEALYLLPSADRFIAECRRILRPGGKVLIATANKDLYDFNPCPHSTVYYNAADLHRLFAGHGFETAFWGFMPVTTVSMRQRLLRPVKKLAVNLNLIPKTMAGKKLLRRLVFGSLVPMPAEITSGMYPYQPPTPIEADGPDRDHKVIYCAATLS